MLTFIGKEAGDNWEEWKDNLHYVDYAVAACIVVGAIYFFVKWRRGQRRRRPEHLGRARGRVGLKLDPGSGARRPPGADGAAAGVVVRATSRCCRSCWAGRTRELDDELRKSFEVALHFGTAAALLIALRHEVARGARARSDARRVVRHVLEILPPAVAAKFWERPIEQRFGTARGVALSQVGGGVALALADRRPALRVHGDAGVGRRAGRSASGRRPRWCPASRATGRR